MRRSRDAKFWSEVREIIDGSESYLDVAGGYEARTLVHDFSDRRKRFDSMRGWGDTPAAAMRSLRMWIASRLANEGGGA